MHSPTVFSCLFILLGPSISLGYLPSDYAPFLSPLDNVIFESEPDSLQFAKRQNCQNGDMSCSNLGVSNVCCPENTVCEPDEAGNVACCPINALCTGTLPGASDQASATGSSSNTLIGGGGATATTMGPSSPGTSSTTSFFFGSTGTSTSTGGDIVTTGTTVPNAPYPFYVIPTSFNGADECSSYYTQCSEQFEECTSTLGIARPGITISGAGGGVSVSGVTATSAAADVCSSLSTAACFGLQLSNCPAFGEATGTATNGNTFVVTDNVAAPTKCPGILYAAGAAMGVAGALM